jgi:predicted nucleic acid-binding protein
MKFWDSSAVIPLLVPEVMSDQTQKLFGSDPVMIVWWATEIECTSAIARRQRQVQLAEELAMDAFRRLSALQAGWHEVEPSDEIRESAKRFLRVHDLRTADALQLAAAFFVAEARPSTLEFVSMDERLLAAARREGFFTTRPGL